MASLPNLFVSFFINIHTLYGFKTLYFRLITNTKWHLNFIPLGILMNIHPIAHTVS